MRDRFFSSHGRVALALAIACTALYVVVLFALYAIGSANGASLERMLGLQLTDISEYTGLARTMLDEGRFALAPDSPPEFFRTPGYPAFLALLFFFGTPPVVVPFMHILFTATAAALIYLIGIRHFPRPIAILAAVLYMLDPLVTYSTMTLISEPLFMLLFLTSIYLVGLETRRPWISYAIGGAVLGIAILVRPVGLYIAPIIALMASARADTWHVAARWTGVFLVTTALVITPWMARNYAHSGSFSLSSISTFNVYYYNIPIFEQFRTGAPYREVRASLNARIGESDEHALRSFSYASAEMKIVREMLLAHPFEYAFFHLLKSGMLIIGSSMNAAAYHMYIHGIVPDNPPPIGAFGMILEGRWSDAIAHTLDNVPKLLERLFWLLAYIGALFTVFLWLRERRRGAVWILGAFLLINAFAILAGPVSDDTRYRIPADPFLFLLGGAAAIELWTKIKKRA